MKFFNVIGAATVVAFGLSAGLNAETFDTNVSACCFWGSGNVNGHYSVDTENGIEVGLRGALRQIGPVTPDAGTSNYVVPTGTQPAIGAQAARPDRVAWNYEFSIDLLPASGKTLSDIHTQLTISDLLHGSTNTYDVLTGPAGHPITDNGPGGSTTLAQNSENFFFTGLGLPGYNVNEADTYTFQLNIYDNSTTPVLLASDSMTIDVVAPEPATWTMIGLGLVSVAFLRRRKA